MIEETLRSIGLSKNETKIYVALLELGPSLMGDICGRTKIHRRNVYDSMEMLKDKGFVSATIINNRNVFEAVHPERILDMLDEQKSGIKAIIPDLLSRKDTKQTSVKVYTGSNGRKIIFEDKLDTPGEQYVLGAYSSSKPDSAFTRSFHERRVKKKIRLLMLFTEDNRKDALTYKKYGLIKSRILPEKFGSPIAINIYGDKVALFLGAGTLEKVSILIENSSLAEDFRAYFRLLWSISKKI